MRRSRRPAGEAFDPDKVDVDVVERLSGGGGIDFGVPDQVTEQDRRPVTVSGATRLAALVEASWKAFDRISKGAPEELRKGPRGGGRDTSKIVDHVLGSEQAYANVMGIKRKEFPTSDRDAGRRPPRRDARDHRRGLATASVLAGKRWTTRYAAHRIAWHALDHAWEIEDRSEPAG